MKPKKNYSTILEKLLPGFVCISDGLNVYSRDKKAASAALSAARSIRADQLRNGTACKLVSFQGMGYVMRSRVGYIDPKELQRTRHRTDTAFASGNPRHSRNRS